MGVSKVAYTVVFALQQLLDLNLQLPGSLSQLTNRFFKLFALAYLLDQLQTFLFVHSLEIFIYCQIKTSLIQLTPITLMQLVFFAKIDYFYWSFQRFNVWKRSIGRIVGCDTGHIFCNFIQSFVNYQTKSIILLMSILTSPHTTRQNQNFFEQMGKGYNKKTFFNENYTEPINPIQQTSDNTSRAEGLILGLMGKFLRELKQIISESKSNSLDYYHVFSEMKGFDFFNEISDILEVDLIQRNQKIEKENLKLKQKLKKLNQQMRESQRSKPTKEILNKHIKFDGVKTIAQNLYEKAKKLNEIQFTELCNKVILHDKVIVKKVADSDNYRKWEDLKLDKIQQKELLNRVDAFVHGKQRQNREDEETELAQLIADFREYNRIKEDNFSCHRPCCNITEQKLIVRSKAFQLRRASQSRKPTQIYKNDKSQEYFNRYYRKSEFDMHKVINVQRTKRYQMERIQDDYRIAMKNRYKQNKSMIK